MAKNKQKQASGKPSVKNITDKPAAPPSSQIAPQRLNYIIVGLIILLTWTFFQPSLHNLFTNWDDPGYIRDNALIKDLSPNGLKNIFSTAVMGNYHPLTILSYAIEYSFVRLDPWLYHLDNLLLHILASVLCYYFILRLTKRPVAAGLTALLFALHPMHVESVAWLAGRKDVLYGSFFIASCTAYLRYREKNNNTRWYVILTVLFICSLLAKPVAVTLPMTLLAIDIFQRRTFDRKMVIEKLPLFAISVAFGIKSMIDQHAFGSLYTQNVHYNAIERMALGGYAFVTYLWKAILPLQLSCFYPYLPKTDNVLPAHNYLYIPAALAILGSLWFFRRNRTVIFGALFFLINIALLLQFIPVGGAILADRYSYIPYIGLFFIPAWYLSGLFEPGANRQRGYLIAGGVITYTLWLGTLTTSRTRVWYDTCSLWRDEIEKQPIAPNAWNNLGFHYFNRFNESVNDEERRLCYDSSLYLLKQAIALDPRFVNPLVSLGELQRGAGKYAEAKEYYYKTIQLKDPEGSANAWLGLAITYAINRNLDSSGISFRNAIAAKPFFPEVHSNYGNYFDMKREMYERQGNMAEMNRMADSALTQYGLAIAQNPDMYAPYLNRGRMHQRMKRCDEGMADFEKALELRPEMGEIFYARSYCYTMRGNKAAALQDVEKALSLGYRNIDPAYYQMLKGR